MLSKYNLYYCRPYYWMSTPNCGPMLSRAFGHATSSKHWTDKVSGNKSYCNDFVLPGEFLS